MKILLDATRQAPARALLYAMIGLWAAACSSDGNDSSTAGSDGAVGTGGADGTKGNSTATTQGTAATTAGDSTSGQGQAATTDGPGAAATGASTSSATGAGGASTSTATATGMGGTTDGGVVNDEYAGNLEISVHDDVNTILVVTWDQLLEADSTWLEFSFEGGEPMTSHPGAGQPGERRDVVLGVPAETDVSVSVVSKLGDAEYKTTPEVGTTGPLLASMPTPMVMDYDPERASPERWLFGAVEDSGDNVANNLNSYLSYQAWLYIMDRQGRIVWYYNDPSRSSPMGFPRIARDGEYIVAEESRVGSQGRVIKMTLDREYFEVIDLPGLADCIDVTDDGSLLFDVGNSGELHELTTDGVDRTLWHCGTELDLSPNCYSNTVNWNPVEDSVFMSFPEPGAVVEIDRQTGEMIGFYGNQPGAWAFAPPLMNPPEQWRFGFQHFPNISPTGTLMISSHMPGYEGFNQTPTPNQHAFIEFAIDREAQTLTEVWRYTEGPEWPRSRGMAVRLGNGNTLGNYGTGGVIREITPDKQTVFYVKFDIPSGNDDYNKLVGHNLLVDDLYALNGGPE